MNKYDFFVAGRWRNREKVKQTLELIRVKGKTAYCFIDNLYEGDKVEFSLSGNIDEIMKNLESLPQSDPFIKKVFDRDMNAEREAKIFLLVLSAGISGHIEAGVAYGLGKKCYAIGQLEKTETLYCIFDKVFDDIESFGEWLA